MRALYNRVCTKNPTWKLAGFIVDDPLVDVLTIGSMDCGTKISSTCQPGDMLGTKVHSYFWLNEYSGKDDFARYWKDEWMSGLTSWCKALKIPDSDVVIQGGCAKVADQLVKDKVYVVWNPGSQFVCAQKQLNVLVDLDSSQTALDPIQSQTVDNIKQETVELVLTNQDTELVNESNCINEDASAHDENCGAVNDAPRVISSDVCDELNDLATSGNRISGENVGEEIRCAEMDVESLSICISPPGLNSVDEVVASNVFSENGNRGLDNTRSKHLPSKVDSSDVNEFQDKDCNENMMDVEPLSIDFPPSTREFLEQCTVTHQDGLADNDLEPTVSNTPDSETKTSSAISLPVESQVLNMIEISGIIKENEGMELKSGNDRMDENLLSADNDVQDDGVHDNISDDSGNGHDAKAVDSMMTE
nr:hypothetical protein CFP56_08452 [Quercus suber]